MPTFADGVEEKNALITNSVARTIDNFDTREELRHPVCGKIEVMIRKLKTGKYRLYSRKPDAKTGKRKNLGTFDTREAAEKHERAVQYFKRKG